MIRLTVLSTLLNGFTPEPGVRTTMKEEYRHRQGGFHGVNLDTVFDGDKPQVRREIGLTTYYWVKFP